MVICVIYNPYNGMSNIIRVSDALPNASVYAKQIANKIAEQVRKSEHTNVKVKCDVPDYSTSDKPIYTLYRHVNSVFIPVAVGDDIKRLFEVTPYSKSIVIPSLTTIVNTLEELLSLINNF